MEKKNGEQEDPEEYERGHLPGARLIPVGELALTLANSPSNSVLSQIFFKLFRC